MRVLFVSSGNSKNFEISPFIKSQGESLVKAGVEVQYFSVKGKGIWGYIKNAKYLRTFLKKNPFDIIHAHYTLSGWTAVVSFPKSPIVLSLMGSDVYGEYIGENKIKFLSKYLTILTYLIQPFVKSIICKSKHIQGFVYLKKKSHVIPNGILLDKIVFNKHGFKEELGLSSVKKHVLFLGNKSEARKNFQVVEKAINLINSVNICLLSPYPVSHDMVIKYLNSVDVLVVPSFMEGSPNIVKEAMACNCPVVATDVGDVRWLFGNEPGYFITGFEPEEVAGKIKMALAFSEKNGRSNGHKRILELGLDDETVAKRIIDVYKDCFDHNTRSGTN
jgi:teichuronic acid biosynthesis glycosyltransferase TuaC